MQPGSERTACGSGVRCPESGLNWTWGRRVKARPRSIPRSPIHNYCQYLRIRFDGKSGDERRFVHVQAAGVSAMAVLGPDELCSDAHLLACGAIVTVDHPEIGPERHVANPLRMSATQLVTAGPAPLLGADTAAVLTTWLGLSETDARKLMAEGICQ